MRKIVEATKEDTTKQVDKKEVETISRKTIKDAIYCPKCNSRNVNIFVIDSDDDLLHCSDCDFEWNVNDYDLDGIPDDEETRKEIEAHIEKYKREKESASHDDAVEGNSKDDK